MSVHFVLDALSSSVTMDVCGQIYSADVIPVDASATAVFYVSLDDMKSVFQFQTDHVDVVNEDATDIKYKIDLASWPELNPANAMFTGDDASGAIATTTNGNPLADDKQLVAHDFVRYLALRLFNTHYGVDLFSNEKELLQNIRLICGNTAAGQTWYDLMAKMTAVSINGDHAGLEGDAGAKYMTNATDSSDNLCKVLFDKLMVANKARFTGIDATEDFQPLPFEDLDTISFKLTIAPAEGQEELTSVAAFEARSYEILLHIRATPDPNTEVATEEL